MSWYLENLENVVIATLISKISNVVLGDTKTRFVLFCFFFCLISCRSQFVTEDFRPKNKENWIKFSQGRSRKTNWNCF